MHPPPSALSRCLCHLKCAQIRLQTMSCHHRVTRFGRLARGQRSQAASHRLHRSSGVHTSQSHVAHIEEALMIALEQCGGEAMLLQAAIIIVCRCSDFFSDPSVVTLVTTMVSAARVQIVAKEGEANGLALETERKATVVEWVAKAAPTPTLLEKDVRSIQRKNTMEVNKEGTNVHLSKVTSPPPSPHLHTHTSWYDSPIHIYSQTMSHLL
jgi:hypothetical protein